MVVCVWHDSLLGAWDAWGAIRLIASGSERIAEVYSDQNVRRDSWPIGSLAFTFFGKTLRYWRLTTVGSVPQLP